jgi:hypothetical protein
MKNVKFTTPTQQPHNNPSHEGGPQCVGFTLMRRVVVRDGVVYESNPEQNSELLILELVKGNDVI